MPSVNYSLNNKGVRLLDSRDAWVKTKTGKFILNPKYRFVGKIDIALIKTTGLAGSLHCPLRACCSVIVNMW